MGKSFNDIDTNLCNFCGACAAVCPVDAISLRDERAVLTGKCISCGLCYENCPGISVSFRELERYIFGETAKSDIGVYRRVALARATDKNTREGASSGGAVTALLSYMFDKRIIKRAVVVGMKRGSPCDYDVRIIKSSAEALACAQSKYCMVPLDSVLRELKGAEGKSAVVGLPCHVHAIRKLQKCGWLGKDIIVISLFCGFNMCSEATSYLIEKLGLKKSEIRRLEYRGGEWPGGFSVEMKNGGKICLPKDVYNFLMPLFVPERCTMCPDLTGELSDISVGDAWVEGRSGWSSVIIRSGPGDSVFEAAVKGGYVNAEPVSEKDILQTHSHLLRYKKRGIKLRMRGAHPEFDVPFGPLGRGELLKEYTLFMLIRLSRNRLLRRIILSLPISLLMKVSSLGKGFMRK